MMVRLLILLSLSLSAYAQVPGCTNVDLRNNAGLGAVRTQGSMGWCTSYVAADLVGYNIGKKLSAVAVALTYNNTGLFTSLRARWEGRVTGESGSGWGAQALSSAINHDLCLESELPSDDPDRQTYNKLHAITLLKREFDQTRSCTRNNLATIQRLFPHISLSEAQVILYYSDINSVHEMLAKVNCKHKPVLPRRPWVVRAYSPLPSVMDALFDRRKIFGLTYSSTILQDISQAGKSGKDGHISTVVARRYNPANRQCEYLVRNSWGPDCGQYDRRLGCEAGNVWVPRPLLLKATSEIVYLE